MEIKEEEQIWKTKYTENFHKKTPFPLVKYKYCLFHPTNDNVVYTLAKVKLQDDVRLELFCPKNTSKELNLIIEKLKESHLDRLQSPVEMEKVNNVDESNSTSQINEKADRGYSDGFMMQYFTHNQEILANEYDESDSDYIDNPPSHKYEKKKFGTFEMGTFIPFEEVEETLEIDVTKKALDILDKNRQKMYNSPVRALLINYYFQMELFSY